MWWAVLSSHDATHANSSARSRSRGGSAPGSGKSRPSAEPSGDGASSGAQARTRRPASSSAPPSPATSRRTVPARRRASKRRWRRRAPASASARSRTSAASSKRSAAGQGGQALAEGGEQQFGLEGEAPHRPLDDPSVVGGVDAAGARAHRDAQLGRGARRGARRACAPTRWVQRRSGTAVWMASITRRAVRRDESGPTYSAAVGARRLHDRQAGEGLVQGELHVDVPGPVLRLAVVPGE